MVKPSSPEKKSKREPNFVIASIESLKSVEIFVTSWTEVFLKWNGRDSDVKNTKITF